MKKADRIQQTIKAVIFDCDGTLVDTEQFHFLAWRSAMRNWGGDLTLEEYILQHVGKSGEAIAKSFAQKVQRDCASQIFAQKRETFLEFLRKGMPPIQPTIDFVHHLMREKKRLGLKLAVASGTVKQEVLLHLEFLGLKDAFDVVLSGHDDLGGYRDPEGVNKPKPYVYLHAARLLGVSPSECIVIEDSHTGVAAGANAGCIPIAIPNAFTKNHDFSRAALQLDTLAGLTVESLFAKATEANGQRNL